MKKQKKKMKPIGFLIIGIIILVVPSIIYLCFLVPKLTTEYNILMASGGAIGGAGMFGTQMIPDKIKYGTLFKTASKSFTMLVVITLVEKFIYKLLGLAVVFIVCYIIFLIMRGLYKDGKQAKQNAQLAEEISRSITETVK